MKIELTSKKVENGKIVSVDFSLKGCECRDCLHVALCEAQRILKGICIDFAPRMNLAGWKFSLVNELFKKAEDVGNVS